jgi:predicted permease
VAVSIIVGYFIIKSRRLPIKVYLPPLVFANTGNMGLPLLLFAFGNEGFKVGILYMVSMTVLHYSLGIMILSFDKSPFELFKLPLLYSAMVGILLSLSASIFGASSASSRRSKYPNDDFLAWVQIV